ncbi:MAG: putative aminohydrolase SsnA [Deltaproteobacteria bacterium]|nr:putative aminohydrolase SsnA [Deltaproteobacteria bacterium]
MLERAGVLVEDGRIKALGPFTALRRRAPRVRTLEAEHAVVLPGLINAHTHLYSALARGMAVPGEPASNFVQILERLWWRLDKVLEPDDHEVSALVGLVDCVRCGVTTIVDHHASPYACVGSLAALRRAVERVGVRAALCYEVSDRDGVLAARAAIEENLRLARALRRHPSDGVTAMFGIHALFTVSDRTLGECVEAARAAKLGLHLHVAEDGADVRYNLRRHGERVVERLHRFGALGPRTLAAHCVHVDRREVGLLARTGTLVAHNPESNMGNAVGFAPVFDLLARGVTVGLGTDGYTADVLRELKVASLIQRHASGDPRRGWAEVQAIAIDGTARLASRVFGSRLGVLAPGAPADLVVFDYPSPTPLRAANLLGHLQFGLDARHIVHVLARGRVLMRDRRLQTVDEGAVMERAREHAARLWQRVRRRPPR